MAATDKLMCRGGMKKKMAKGGKVTKVNKPTVGIKDKKLVEGYPVGTPLKEIFNIPADLPEQSILESLEPTKDALNRARWANFHGKLTEYPKGRAVPSFRYTPNVLEEMEKRGLTREYIESWQPANYPKGFNAGGFINYQEGGEVIEEIPGLGSAMKLNKAIYGTGSEMLGKLGEAVFSAKRDKAISDYDSRENPMKTMEEINAADTGSALVSGAAKGASAGAAFGPIGVGIGAAAGLITSGIGRLIGKEKREDEIEEATSKWSKNRTDLQKSYVEGATYKDGGKIKGKGGPKSDQINMTAKDGSFIVPAENAESAMELGKSYLGWDDKTYADRQNGGDGIKVSDGEVFFTPEEVGTLGYYGVDLNELAPNAKPEHKMKSGGMKKKIPEPVTPNYQDGGYHYDPDRNVVVGPDGIYGEDGTVFAEGEIGQSGQPDLIQMKSNDMYASSIWDEYGPEGVSEESVLKPSALKQQEQAEAAAETEDNVRKWYDYVPELAGAIQMAGGAAGLMAAGKKPDLAVSHTLKKLSAETRRLAQFGYEPAVLNALNSQIERARRDTTKAITGRGGSPQEVMANLQKVLSTTIDKKAGIMFANAQEKARKWADVIRVDTGIAAQEFDIDKIELSEWYKTQDVFANMLSAGISNIVGARQLKSEQDALSKIGTSNPTFRRT